MDRKTTTLGLLSASVGAVAAAGTLMAARARAEAAFAALQGPKAEKIIRRVYFGNVEGEDRGPNPMDPPVVRTDPFFWMRDDTRKDPKIIAHIEKENRHTEAQMAPLKGVEEQIYQEFLSHMLETESKLPYPRGLGYYYYTRTEQGKSYPFHCRKERPGVETAPIEGEEMILDVNRLSVGKNYTDVGVVEPSPDHSLVGISADFSGYETYEIFFRVAGTEEPRGETLKDVDSTIVWGTDNSTVFYLMSFPLLCSLWGEISFFLRASVVFSYWGGEKVWSVKFHFLMCFLQVESHLCLLLLTVCTFFLLCLLQTFDEEHRPHKVWMHTLGTPQSDDILLFTEDDKRFWVGVDKSNSGRFLLIGTGSKVQDEYWFVDLKDVKGADAHKKAAQQVKCMQKRLPDLRYDVEHWGDSFYMVTNKDGAKNGKIMKTPISSPGVSSWKELFPYNSAVQYKRLLPFKNKIAVSGREGGFSQVWVLDPASGKIGRVPMEEEAHMAWISSNYLFETELLRFGYSSLTTPSSLLDYNMTKGTSELLWQQNVPNYVPEEYEAQRIVAPSHDGTLIPMSIVYSKKVYPEGPEKASREKEPVPTMLYGYGSYGVSVDPSFDFKRIPLLNRGMVYAIAHIRGGGEMGRPWYEDEGKFLTKKNTFLDFVAAAERLTGPDGFTSPERLGITGRSAGGLLIGATLNLRPDLFGAAVADVPFVDVMTTMCDPSIPLTVGEWEEWGNPNEQKFFYYMLEYSPYDNIRHEKYPALLVTAGLNDPRVAYWEPCKWVAKLRETKNDSHQVLLKVDMSSGHFSASDRYKNMRERAFEYAFVVDRLGCKDLLPCHQKGGRGECTK
uniref:Prolyl endopeptidase n=1 Tax=Chromera velia CCMP2878 TaxID=1169474 RepID=A0A0G4FNG3_9ALVE|eukprot:Cvel_3557.t1-p1 / transcript=Cvel_3557.t1 / gene=Cvel_3557 / organism=Chromera_velia_CCMP2878 / gene_product=Protease 2, putative / transcript_product=Protease 2, putative / location=Cvel_scaffold145:70736-82531(+) / protein_length=839 / sequence_SO=supercontig / SO=protein_coding / is_pseudo=false